ncbi:MAG: hypothetical protein WCS34_08225 [Bacteroidales bacterium]
MKKFIVILVSAACAGLLLVSCNDNRTKASDVSLDFLNAYFSTDYNKAASFCDDSLSSKLLEACQNFENLDSTIKADIISSSKNIKFSINSSKKINDSLMEVSYQAEITSDTAPIESKMILKKSDETWKITELGSL